MPLENLIASSDLLELSVHGAEAATILFQLKSFSEG